MIKIEAREVNKRKSKFMIVKCVKCGTTREYEITWMDEGNLSFYRDTQKICPKCKADCEGD